MLNRDGEILRREATWIDTSAGLNRFIISEFALQFNRLGAMEALSPVIDN